MRMPSPVDTVLTCWKRMVNSSSVAELIAKSNAFSSSVIDDPNIFKVSVGNLPPGKEVKITITYVAELEFVEGVVRNLIQSTNAN